MSDISISPYGFGNAPRGQDPMGQANQVTNQYQPHPMARFIGQMMDYLQDPRVGMAFPGAGLARMGFRATGPNAMRALRETEGGIQREFLEHGGPKPWSQVEVTQPGLRKQGLAEGMLESVPTPYQQATVLRQGDNGMARMKALDSVKQSNGWTDEQLQHWLLQNSADKNMNSLRQSIGQMDNEVINSQKRLLGSGAIDSTEYGRRLRGIQGDKSGPGDDITQLP